MTTTPEQDAAVILASAEAAAAETLARAKTVAASVLSGAEAAATAKLALSDSAAGAIAHIAERASTLAVEKFILRIGVDPSDPDAIGALKTNLAYLNSLRSASDTIKKQGLIVAVSSIVVATIGILMLGFNSWLHPPVIH